MSKAWWIEFEDGGPPGCVEAPEKTAAEVLAVMITGRTVAESKPLPHPATPRLNEVPRDDEGRVCPSFCYTPVQCAGRTTCPKRRACTE